MDENVLNIETRKFLKEVGVTSQRRIEQAIQAALEAGNLAGRNSLRARMVLTIDEVGLRHEIEGEIKIGD